MPDRGKKIEFDDIMKIEHTRDKERYSVTGYLEELDWMIELLQEHKMRVQFWKDTPEERHELGDLHTYLSEFEEV